MGLFGGFKAKLKGNRKKVKEPTTVVCVKYNFFSEFDSPQNSLPSTSYQDMGRNEVVREKKVLPKPNMETMFKNQPATVSESVKSNGEVVHLPAESKSETPKSKNKKNAVVHLPVESKSETPKSKNKKKAVKEPAAKPPKVNKTSPSKAATVKQTTIETEKEKSTKKVTKEEPPTRIVAETPDLTSPPTPEENIYAEYDDGNFQIHVATHDDFYTNLSEEESSEVGDIQGDFVMKPGMSPLNFSSQATSIFFGGDDEEPVVLRPRNIVMHDDNSDATSHGSSASA